ncbi:hypothetical protein ACGFZP_22000 [Kitasatospora sp. NPDC048239]|uniref:hypothetical protein n=1 Tax=Kitasatospora sp. NPDC048239 TaxID=3364046 RepID=UPI00372463C9
MGKKKIFKYPDDLRAAQRALVVVRAERSAFFAVLPRWADLADGVGEGLSDEQRAESGRLEEAERVAALAVYAHPFWAGLPAEARTRLQHLDDESAAEASAA